MPISHKIQLKPNNQQVEYFKKACGTARFVYNWGLAEWNKQYKEGKKPKVTDLKKQFNEIKYEQFSWIEEIHRDAHSDPFDNLGKAFVGFFRKKSKYPQFKKKGKTKDSFYVANDRLSVNEKVIKLPRIGKIRMTEELRFKSKIQSAVVSRTADKWFVSISTDDSVKTKPRLSNNTIGLDVGIKSSIVTSEGKVFQSPKALKKHLKRIQKLNRNISRKYEAAKKRKEKIQSRKMQKERLKLAKEHYKVVCKRNDFLHKVTTQLCRENQAIFIEDLNVKGMVKNRKLARSLSDESFGELRRQLEYKSKAYGVKLVKVDRFYPSSKKCSKCGEVKKELKLSERVYKCSECGLEIDRDLNAAKNICNFTIPLARGEFKPLEKLSIK